jgi:hypothetical protein
MPNPTPFFSAFRRVLFGRHRASRIEQLLLRERGAASLNQYQSAFGKYIPDALLAPTSSGPNSRKRIFSPRIIFWAFLAQVLERGSSCRDALRRICAWWKFECPRRSVPSEETGGYCQARARLDESTLQTIGSDLADQLERNATKAHLWKGRRVKIIDGTSASMPDTYHNQQCWPQPKGQQRGCGFPVIKLVGLFCLATGAMLRYVHSTLFNHDAMLARELWKLLDPLDVLLADRAFCSYLDLSLLKERGVDALMRLHQMRRADFRQGRPLGKDDRLIVWTKPSQLPGACTQEQYAAMPQTLTLRMLRYRVGVPGFRTEEVVLITTLADAKTYPREDLAQLYFQRWHIELHFREIKTLLGMDVLRCLSPAMILKEVAMHRVAYNLVRTLMQRAALDYDVPLDRISFKGTLDSLHHFADVIHASAGKPRKQALLLDQLLHTVALDQLPLRPDRSEPRVRKRRPKSYQFLTQPRHKMRPIPHRNRYRAPKADALN